MKGRAQIKAYLTPNEKREVTALANQARLTTSELIRRLVLNQKLPNVRQHEAVIDLVKINADQARLGNLLRMALMDEDFRPPQNMDLNTLFENIRTTQDILKSKIMAL